MENELEVFEQGWPGNDTICGWGSTIEHTKTIRTMLPRIIKMTEAKVLNDAGCGDLFWIQHTDLSNVDYMGYDLYERSTWPELRNKGWKLEVANIAKQNLRPSDLIMCRDVFIHLPNRIILDVLDRFRKTTKYLFTTNFISPVDLSDDDYWAVNISRRHKKLETEKPKFTFSNFDRITNVNMHHSKLDLRLAPFNLGNPITMIIEDYPYKNMSLWKL